MTGLLTPLALLVVGPAVASQAASPEPAAAVVAQQEPDPQSAPTPIPPPPTEPPAEPEPPPTPAPEPGPPPPPPDPELVPDPSPSPSCADGGDPALWDVGGQVRQAITEFFCDFAEDTLNSVLTTLGESVLATPDLTGNEQIRDVWVANLVIANTIYVLFIVAAGFVVAARESLQTSYGLKELIPRIVVAGLAANLSLLLVGQGIEFVNAITAGIAGQGVEPATAAEAVTTIWENASVGTSFLLSLLMIAIIVMAIIVLITFIIRVAVLAVLITIAPLALLFHALPQTEQVAFTWWKAVAGCFAIQLGQTVVLVAAVRIFLTPVGPTVLGFPSSGSGWLGILVALAMMWLLVKIPMWVKQYMWLQSRGVLRKIILAVFMLKTLSLAAAGQRGRGGHGGRGGARPQPAPSGHPRPGPRPNSGPRPNPRPQPGGGNRPGLGRVPNRMPPHRWLNNQRPAGRGAPLPPPPRPAAPSPAGRRTGTAAPSTAGPQPRPSNAPVPGGGPPSPAPSPGDRLGAGQGQPSPARPDPAATREPVRYSGARPARQPASAAPPGPSRPGQPDRATSAPTRPATSAPPQRPTPAPPPPVAQRPGSGTKTTRTGATPASPPKQPPPTPPQPRRSQGGSDT
ncbi:MAG: hypothetical protein GEV12_12170 [Micromonosporaceae bacterium]|nr:hypothetical protein [Micromonosporaceae bacterium]